MRSTVLVLCAFSLFGKEPVQVGQKLESISLRDLTSKPVTFSTTGKVTAVIFYSTQCPISNEYNDRLQALYRDYSAKGVQLIFADANVNESVREITEHSKAAGFPFQVYQDPQSALADTLGASVTPEAYVFDMTGVLRYHGHIDDARNPARAQVNGLRNALDEVLEGKAVTRPETKGFGCTIKRPRKAN